MGEACLSWIREGVSFTKDNLMVSSGFCSYLNTLSGNGFGNGVKDAGQRFRFTVLFIGHGK